MSAKIKITLHKSTIGYAKNQKETARSLGLRKLQHSAIHNDTPAIRGMIHTIQHLVSVETVEAE